jgi:hypothetical protein
MALGAGAGTTTASALYVGHVGPVQQCLASEYAEECVSALLVERHSYPNPPMLDRLNCPIVILEDDRLGTGLRLAGGGLVAQFL